MEAEAGAHFDPEIWIQPGETPNRFQTKDGVYGDYSAVIFETLNGNWLGTVQERVEYPSTDGTVRHYYRDLAERYMPGRLEVIATWAVETMKHLTDDPGIEEPEEPVEDDRDYACDNCERSISHRGLCSNCQRDTTYCAFGCGTVISIDETVCRACLAKDQH